MEITGYFKQAFEPESGVSAQSGNTWVRQTFLIETGGQYNNDIAFDIWNNKCDVSQFTRGNKVNVKFNISSHDFTDKNGKVRYSHNIMAYSVSKVVDNAVPQTFQKQTPPPDQQMQPVNPPTDAQDNGEPLPF